MSQTPLKPFVEANGALRNAGRLQALMREHGYFLLRNIAPRQRVLQLRKDVLDLCRDAGWIVASQDPYEGRWSSAGPFTEGEGPYMDVYKKIVHLPSFRDLPEDLGIQSLMEKIVDGPVLVHKRNIGRVTFPQNATQSTGAHQDFFYIHGTPDTYTMWIPIGDCPMELGGLAILDGSHAAGLIEHTTIAGKKYAQFGLPDESLPTGRAWHSSDMSLGDVLVFHSYTIHKALPNLTADQLRISIDNRYQRRGDAIEPGSMGTHYGL